MTESEAREKWCPMVRVTASDTEWHTNRPSIADVAESGFDRCAGSKCMAWRWIGTHIKNEAGDGTVWSTNTHGYCGLGGRP